MDQNVVLTQCVRPKDQKRSSNATFNFTSSDQNDKWNSQIPSPCTIHDMMWLMWRIPRLRDRKYFVPLKGNFFLGLTSMVSASTRMYKKKLEMVDYARTSTRNVRTPSSIILRLSGNRDWCLVTSTTEKKTILYRR